MCKKLLITASERSKLTEPVDRIYSDLGKLLRIHGFQIRVTTREHDLSRYIVYSFRERRILESKEFSNPGYSDELPEELEHMLISQISLFPNPDLFLIDSLDYGILKFKQFNNQLRTIFASKIPVVLTASRKSLDNLSALQNIGISNEYNADSMSAEEIYLNILARLG